MTEDKKAAEMKRQALLSMNDEQADKLPPADRYERIRYLREQEALNHINHIAISQLSMHSKPVAGARKCLDKPVRNYYERDKDWDSF